MVLLIKQLYDQKVYQLSTLTDCFINEIFLVACTRLNDPLCPSVGRSVHHALHFLSFCIILSNFKLFQDNYIWSFVFLVFWSHGLKKPQATVRCWPCFLQDARNICSRNLIIIGSIGPVDFTQTPYLTGKKHRGCWAR